MIEKWLRDRRINGYLKKFGGIQKCPWCTQWAQDNNTKWSFKPYKDNPMYDVLTCGVCNGTSLWLWGHGMHYIMPLDHPAIKEIRS